MDISVFEDLLSSPYNRLVQDAMNQGRIPIGYSCAYVPDALLSVGDFFPVRLRAPGISGTELADTYLSSVICSYTRSLLEFVLDDRYDFIQGWLFTDSCDHLRRLYDNIDYLIKPDFIHILDVPHRYSEAALKWYIEEIQNLIDKMAEHFKVTITHTHLQQAIFLHNRVVRALLSIGDLRKLSAPPISGCDFHKIMLVALTTPKDLFLNLIQPIQESLTQHPHGKRNYRARLMLVGGHMDDIAYIETIESSGGLVVADRYCTGSLPELMCISEDNDPIVAIAEHIFMRTACPRMMDQFEKRFQQIIQWITEYQVDGVIIEAIKFCDLWGIESSVLLNELRKKGIPAIRLEREYRLSGEGQLSTRVQAFLESMGK